MTDSHPPADGSPLLGPDGEPLAPSSARGRPNRLIGETSPYLLQHAYNPVDWYPWGDEAFDRARAEDRPVFLSVGYAACHWCHVMERESFENEEIAAFLNANFVSVKVDREERPDVDDIYMAAVQMISRQGGWPMSVFLTPDRRPFFGGTYFPPDDRYGRPGFLRLLQGLLQAYRDRREEIESGAEQVMEGLRAMAVAPAGSGAPGRAAWDKAVAELAASFDETYGGFGSAPKFPHSFAIQILLREHVRSGDARALAMVTRTLDGMARGGLYDHLGGGFHRYATDERWLVPHFEKMLYDQALLVVAYSEAVQVTRSDFYARVVRETCDYVLRDLTSPDGAFYSTEDADSEGVEGRFYVWNREDVLRILGAEDGALFCRAYDVDEGGNWEGVSILQRVRTTEELATLEKATEDEVEVALTRSCARLLQERGTRVRPARDEKVLTAWNGLMIRALARAGRVLEEPRFLDAAERAAAFVLGTLRVEGRLHRVWKDGRVRIPGYLEDHVHLGAGLLELYEATFEPRWLREAEALVDAATGLFEDRESGGFFLTTEDHGELVVRMKMAQDGSVPSGNSMAADLLLRLGRLGAREDLEARGRATLEAFQSYLDRMPAALHQMLLALDFELGPRQEVVFAGDAGSEAGRSLRRVLDRSFLPRAVVGHAAGGRSDSPLFEGKVPLHGSPAVYVCRDYACDAPVTDPAELSLRLSEEGSERGNRG